MSGPRPDVDGGYVAFAADAEIARQLNERVIERLGESVDLIVEGLKAQAPLDHDIATLGPRILAGGARACTFAQYFELLPAVLADDADATRSGLAAMSRIAVTEPFPFVTDWSRLDAGRRTLFLARLNADESTQVTLRAPTPESVVRATAAIAEALSAFDLAAPGISGEVRTMVREIVLVSGTISDGYFFDGATSFATWGALFLNADEHATRIEAIDGLSHECAHAFLFGQSFGEPFVENDESERHASPLRRDPRPLDGIFHATFVSARMHAANAAVVGCDVLSAEEREIAAERCAASLRAFADGRATLRRYARLTALGERLLTAADTYMEPFLPDTARQPADGFTSFHA